MLLNTHEAFERCITVYQDRGERTDWHLILTVFGDVFCGILSEWPKWLACFLNSGLCLTKKNEAYRLERASEHSFSNLLESKEWELCAGERGCRVKKLLKPQGRGAFTSWQMNGAIRAKDGSLLPAFQIGCRGLIHLSKVTDSIEPGNHAVGLFGAFVSRGPGSFIVTYIHLCSLPIIPISGGQRRQKGRGYINGIEPQSIQSQIGLVPSAFRIFKPFLIELVWLS